MNFAYRKTKNKWPGIILNYSRNYSDGMVSGLPLRTHGNLWLPVAPRSRCCRRGWPTWGTITLCQPDATRGNPVQAWQPVATQYNGHFGHFGHFGKLWPFWLLWPFWPLLPFRLFWPTLAILASLSPTWSQLGPTYPQLGAKMASRCLKTP